MKSLEKGNSGGVPINKQSAKESGDYYLEDDDALMRLLQRVDQIGESGL